jgi:hypothetical protein
MRTVQGREATRRRVGSQSVDGAARAVSHLVELEYDHRDLAIEGRRVG